MERDPDLTPPRPGERAPGVMQSPDAMEAVLDELDELSIETQRSPDYGVADGSSPDASAQQEPEAGPEPEPNAEALADEEEMREAREFLARYREGFVLRMLSAVDARAVMLDYYRFDYDPQVRIEEDAVRNFVAHAEQFTEVYFRLTELFEDDPEDWERHSLSVPFLCAKFERSRPVFRPYVRKFRWTMYAIRYVNQFVQALLRVRAGSMAALRALYREQERAGALQSLESLFDGLSM